MLPDGGSRIVVVGWLALYFLPVDPGLGLTFTSVFVAVSVDETTNILLILQMGVFIVHAIN